MRIARVSGILTRALLWILLLAGVVTVGATIAVHRIIDQGFNSRAALPKVLGVDPARLPAGPADPYNGPFPSELQFAETFSFPLREGMVGPVEPLFAGSPQVPFLCRTVDSDLGQPLVDNQDGYGMAVFQLDAEGDPSDRVAGFSQDCLLPTRIKYWALGDDGFQPWSAGADRELVVRVETGTINRFIYMIAMPVDPAKDSAMAPDLSRWNHRLIYHFRGGVGIGYRQGRLGVATILKRRQDQLSLGYAVVHSTGNQTSNTYNIWLNADTALRVKRQFAAAYGEPVYTVGVGGSGGAIQQYLMAQGFPGILDAAIALYSYPDMVSQSLYVLDCELLEYYFDRLAPDPARWADVRQRAPVLGTSVDPNVGPDYELIYGLSGLASGHWPTLSLGATECTRAWRGAGPLVINPRYAHFGIRFDPEVAAATDLTYFGDLARYYGTDDAGFGRRTWDNMGVQYGLNALRNGDITLEEFLHLNQHVGGWKPPAEMLPPRYWLSDAAPSELKDFSPWSHHNMTTTPDGSFPRSRGDLGAMAGAYRSGQVFLGLANIPVIDLRHYLEPELDMHHAVSSFQARARMIRASGHADNQLIWMTRPPHAPYVEAFELIDRWMAGLANGQDVQAARPGDATDRCWDADGRLLAEGPGVWNGDWNQRAPGRCMEHYPAFATTRIAAGEGYFGDVFKCHLQPVEQAVQQGVYEPVDVAGAIPRLRSVFPDGVCDYRKGDAAFPDDLQGLMAQP